MEYNLCLIFFTFSIFFYRWLCNVVRKRYDDRSLSKFRTFDINKGRKGQFSKLVWKKDYGVIIAQSIGIKFSFWTRAQKPPFIVLYLSLFYIVRCIINSEATCGSFEILTKANDLRIENYYSQFDEFINIYYTAKDCVIHKYNYYFEYFKWMLSAIWLNP